MMEYEGNRRGWHIRLVRRVPVPSVAQAAYRYCGETVTAIETWQLFHNDEPESSPVPKSVALDWMREEQAAD